jgi:hypothetical protein
MQLCTNARLFLDMVAASGQPKLWELSPPEAREKVIELTRLVECEEAIGNIEDRTLRRGAAAGASKSRGFVRHRRRALRARRIWTLTFPALTERPQQESQVTLCGVRCVIRGRQGHP